jgi:N-acetylglucosamine-6-sulfatase
MKITRREILAPAVLLGQRALKWPNFVFIFTDDQRWDAVSAFGRQPWLRTPNMDRLVREGASFRNSFVTTSLCSPSRSSYLTGQYAHKTGVVDNARTSFLRAGVPTVAALLRKAGYATGYTGKIHIPNFWERDHGFDYYASFPGQGLYFKNPFLVNGKKVPTEGYITDHINRFALEFLKQRDPGKPFALFVGHKAVHGPWLPRPDHAHVFDKEWFPLPKTWDDDYRGRPPYLKARRKSWHGLEGMLERLPKMKIGGYSELQRSIAACLMSVDEGLGQILDALAKTRELNNTVVIYSSDNGFFQGEHGLNDKRAMYEDSIRVPLLVRYPPLVKAGTTFNPMVLNIDLAPTLLDFAGAGIPSQIQGRSWMPVLTGTDLRGRTDWLYEYFWEKPYPFDPTQFGVRTQRYKYIRYPDVGNKDAEYPMPNDLPYDELYDLESDPFEMRNLAGDPAAGGLLAKMKDLLKRRLDETQYPGGFL